MIECSRRDHHLEELESAGARSLFFTRPLEGTRLGPRERCAIVSTFFHVHHRHGGIIDTIVGVGVGMVQRATRRRNRRCLSSPLAVVQDKKSKQNRAGACSGIENAKPLDKFAARIQANLENIEVRTPIILLMVCEPPTQTARHAAMSAR